MRRLKTLWLLPALALGAPVALAALDPSPASTEAETPGDLATLQEEYDAAFAAWKAEFDLAEGRARAELRKSHPTRSFWERYEALGRSGEGRAYQWLLGNAKDLGLKKEERGQVIQGVYAALLEGHADEAWFDEVVSRVARDVRYLGEASVERWLATASETAKEPMASALATLKHAELLADSSDEAKAKKGQGLLAEYEQANLQVGATALDFRARTLDGHAFKLSDYRGKAVLIDFYGFW